MADFIVLADKPPAVDPTRLRDIVIERAIVGGRGTFARAATSDAGSERR